MGRNLCATAWIAVLLLIFLVSWPKRIGLAAEPAEATTEAAQPREALRVIQLPEIQVTATREPETTFDVSRGVTVLTPEEVERRLPESEILPDLLRGKEGAYVQQTTPGQGTVIIRGLMGSEVLNLVDGMRLNTAFFRNAPNQFLALVDAQNVEQVEVVRGPASTLYGSDAMGGVVQAITPIPRFEGKEWQLGSKLRGHFASADLSWLSRLSLKAGKEAIAFSGGVTYQDVNDRRVGGGDVIPNSGFTAYAGDAKIVLTPGNDHEMPLNLQYLEQPKTPRVDELVPGFGQTTPSSSVFNFEPNSRLFLHGRYRMLQPLSFVDTLRLNVAYQEITDGQRQRNFGSVIENLEQNKSELIGVTLQAHSHWRDVMDFTYGAEVYLDKILSSRTLTNIETGASRVAQSRFPDGSTMDSYAFYIQDEIRPSSALVVTLGGRFSHIKENLPPADRGVGVALNFNRLTGNLGLVYHQSPTVRLVANIGQGFRAPNVFDLGTLGPRAGNRFNLPNTALEPETVLTADWGFKVLTSNFQGEVFGFYSSYKDKIASVTTGAVTPDGRIVVQNRNLNRVIFWGAEMGARFRMRDDLELYGSLTYTWGQEEFPDGSQAPADRVPPLNGSLSVLYRPRPALWVESSFRFAARQDRLSSGNLSDPRINPDGTPGWATFNVKLGWDPAPNFGLRFAVENITDANYREHGSGINAPGVNAVLSVECRF